MKIIIIIIFILITLIIGILLESRSEFRSNIINRSNPTTKPPLIRPLKNRIK